MSAAIPGGRSALDRITALHARQICSACGHKRGWHEEGGCTAPTGINSGCGCDGFAVLLSLRELSELSALLTAAGSAPTTTHGHHFSDTTWAGQAQPPKRCPRCDSPSPELHPSVQWEGEVQPCSDPWHSQPTNRTPVAAQVPHTPDLNIAWQNIDRALVHLPDDQLCGVWPDGSGLRGAHIKHLIAELRGAAVPAQAPRKIEDAFKAGFDAHIAGHRGTKGCASAFAGYVKTNQVPVPAQAPPPDLAATCLDCGLGYEHFGLDLLLPRSQWMEIHPSEGGLLCARCLVLRASKLRGATAVHAVIECWPDPIAARPSLPVQE